jgi:hypothetical protein
MFFFKKNIKKEKQKSYKKGADDKERELFPVHQKELRDLQDEKDCKIAELESELASRDRRMAYWQKVYRDVTKERVQVKMDRKAISKLAEDMFYILNEDVTKNNEILCKIGDILGNFLGKRLPE